MQSYLKSPSLSLYALPLVWYAGFYPMNKKFYMISTLKQVGGYNKFRVQVFAVSLWYTMQIAHPAMYEYSVQPRANTKRIKDDPSVDPEFVAKVERCEGAHLNGMENLPLWIGAILAGHVSGVAHETLNIATVAYLGMRMLYNYVYINSKTDAGATLRSGVFFGSLGIPLWLYVKAANTLRLRGA